MRNIFKYCLLILLLFSGCEKEYTWDFKSDGTTYLVVDGMITNEYKSQCIKLSMTNPDLNEGWHSVSGADITVNDGLSTHLFIESVNEPGYYYSEEFQAVIDRDYRLTVIIGTDTFIAETVSTPVSAMDEVRIDISKNDTLYRYVHTGQGNPSMTEVYYDWSRISAYCEEYGSCYAQETFYTLNNVDVNALFSPDRQIIYFPSGTIIIRRKYGLTEGHQRFIRSLLMESDWSGGIFDVQHGNIETNLSNGALGYFAVCMVVSDTISVE